MARDFKIVKNKCYMIYTDGGARPNPGTGAWAALIECGGDVLEISGGEDNTTNNRMELMASIMALKYIQEGSIVTIYTDSQYVKKKE